jgi:hypothetical protein
MRDACHVQLALPDAEPTTARRAFARFETIDSC